MKRYNNKRGCKKNVSIKASIEDFRNLEFEEQMDWLLENGGAGSDLIWSYDSLKDFAIWEIEQDDVGFALYILEAIYNSSGASDWYTWDASSGTMSSIEQISDGDDAEDLYITIFGED